MDDIIEKDMTTTTVENYHAVSMVKYHIRAKGMTSLEMPVMPFMRYNSATVARLTTPTKTSKSRTRRKLERNRRNSMKRKLSYGWSKKLKRIVKWKYAMI